MKGGGMLVHEILKTYFPKSLKGFSIQLNPSRLKGKEVFNEITRNLLKLYTTKGEDKIPAAGKNLLKEFYWKKNFKRFPKLELVRYALRVSEIETMDKGVFTRFNTLVQKIMADGSIIPSEHDIHGLYMESLAGGDTYSKNIIPVMYTCYDQGVQINKSHLEWLIRESGGITNPYDLGRKIIYALANGIDIRGQLANFIKLVSIAMVKNKYRRGNENLALAEELTKFSYPESAFEYALNQMQKPKLFESIPDVGMIQEKEYKIVRLAADDPRGWTLGEYTKCCQHIGGAGESSARHGMTSGDACFFVAYKGNYIYAQTWAWRKKGVVYFDNVEALSKSNTCKKLFRSLAERLLGKFGIKEIRTGLGNNDIYSSADGVYHNTPKSDIDFTGCYTDTKAGYIVLASEK